MPPADLPESFELDTTLHLGQADWSVIDAQPRTRADYSRSKALMLRLRKVEMIDPKKILFSLPTICDEIPQAGDKALLGDEFRLAEDDWRQVEFVSTDLASEIEDEIVQIRLIHTNASAGVGWRELHVRRKPVRPLTFELRLHDLEERLGIKGQVLAIGYRGANTQIVDGFSIMLEEQTIYGLAPDGNIQVLAIAPSPAGLSVGALQRLKGLAHDFKLELVDWCACARLSSNDPQFDAMFVKDKT